MLEVKFYEQVDDGLLKFAVVISKTDGKYVEIIDRKEAIAYAIHHGEPGDIIVLAGKGHEDYQEIQGVRYPMDERTLVSDAVKALKEEGVEGLI